MGTHDGELILAGAVDPSNGIAPRCWGGGRCIQQRAVTDARTESTHARSVRRAPNTELSQMGAVQLQSRGEMRRASRAASCASAVTPAPPLPRQSRAGTWCATGSPPAAGCAASRPARPQTGASPARSHARTRRQAATSIWAARLTRTGMHASHTQAATGTGRRGGPTRTALTFAFQALNAARAQR